MTKVMVVRSRFLFSQKRINLRGLFNAKAIYVQNFLVQFSQKSNIIALLEFEHLDFETVVLLVSNNAQEIPHRISFFFFFVV